MNYVEKKYAEIFESMLEDSLEKGLISHAEEFKSYIANHQDISNYYVMDKSVIAQLVAEIYKSITSVYESSKVEYAEGQDLDDIGKIIGISRPEATRAQVICTFSTAISEEDINVDEGVIVSTRSGIQFKTVEPIFIGAGSTSDEVVAEAVVPGVGSKIIENSISIIESDLDLGMRVTNASSSTGGRDAYTDDEYRYLLMNWTKIYLKGSLEAYEYYFASFDGLESYKLVPNWDDSGTMKIVLDPGTNYQLNKAYTEIQKSVVQATEDITMFAPTNRPIDIFATVNVDIDQINPYSSIEKEEIQARIKTACKIFIDGGYRRNGTYYPGLYLGEDFIPHKLSVFLDEEIPELKNITFSYPKNYVVIDDEEIGVSNNITIEMM